jgi:DNA repair exonuclease SbcCD ATPase subunit
MLKFKAIRWKNFLSTGSQFTEVKLDRSPTTLIIGENGAGKSTILDALCFGLFGKAFRNINKAQLINTINQKHTEVQIEFSIGKKDYRVVRGIKPNTFEIYTDGEMINQDADARDYQKYLEDQILKLNYKSFTQVVILGSASFTPFMQLPAAHRREIIEDLLDIRIFTAMNEVWKEKYAEIKLAIADKENEIDLVKEKAKLQQEYISKLEVDRDKKTKDTEQLIEDAGNEIKRLTSIVEAKVEEKEKLLDSIADEKNVKQTAKQLESLYVKLTDKVRKIQDEVGFYHSNETCPTCNQNLETSFKNDKIDELHKKLHEMDTAVLDLSNKIKENDARIEAITSIKDEISVLVEYISDTTSKITAEQNYVKKLIRELKDQSADETNIDEEKTKLKEIAKQIVKLSEDKSKLTEDKHYYDVAGVLLKDTGIKTKIIKQYLPVINKLVNKYLQAMDFFVHFELDETFSETIKSRHRDEFSYASFSEGEKQRIDLALLFAWRSIAKMKNSANTNLLILDEVFDSSLDVNGTDFVMNLLWMLGEDTNCFVISHKDVLFDKFRSVIKFEKHNNFSQMV